MSTLGFKYYALGFLIMSPSSTISQTEHGLFFFHSFLLDDWWGQGHAYNLISKELNRLLEHSISLYLAELHLVTWASKGWGMKCVCVCVCREGGVTGVKSDALLVPGRSCWKLRGKTLMIPILQCFRHHLIFSSLMSSANHWSGSIPPLRTW